MKERFYALDVFRGATVCLMILVNNPGSWDHIYAPLKHASWYGLTPTDLVFPFFLFAVGNALSFVMPNLQKEGERIFWSKIIKRSILIFLIGLGLNWWPFVKWDHDFLIFKYWVDIKHPQSGVRIMGVLQRIALCYFVASIIIYYFKSVKVFYAGIILLLLYWFVCIIGNPSDPYSLNGWFGTSIDKFILGIPHMYKGEGIPFDPEGLLSTIPAVVEVIFGYLIGDYIQKKGKNYEMISGLFVIGIALLLTGWCWNTVFPINKKIWTSSYTVFTSGLATITISTLIYLTEFKNLKGKISEFFNVFGKNPLFVFALSAFLPKTLGLIHLEEGVNPWNFLYKKVLIQIPGAPEFGSLLYAICVIMLMWYICYWLDKKKIYFKV